MEDGQDELDVGIVSNAICQSQPAGVALASLVARAESLVEDTVLDGAAVTGSVQVTLIRLELCNGDRLARREDRELDVLAVW